MRKSKKVNLSFGAGAGCRQGIAAAWAQSDSGRLIGETEPHLLTPLGPSEDDGARHPE